jgi:hypothetical protein
VCRDVWLIKNYYRCGDVFADGKYGFLLWTCPWRTEQGQVQLTTVNHPRVSLVPQNPKSAAAIPTPGQGELSPKQLPCFAEILLSVFSHFLSPLPMNPTKGLSLLLTPTMSVRSALHRDWVMGMRRSLVFLALCRKWIAERLTARGATQVCDQAARNCKVNDVGFVAEGANAFAQAIRASQSL